MTRGRFIPSLLIPEVYFPFNDDKSFTPDLIERLAGEGFYKSFEIGDNQDLPGRKRIAAAASANGIEITQWMTFLIDRNGLDVSALDSALRRETVRQIKDSLYAAAESGASNIALVTGPDPGADRRAEALDGLYESLCDIGGEAATYGMQLLIEPLDRFAHKKRLIGPTAETLQLIERVSGETPNIGLAFDTAHAALNGENVFEALELAKERVRQIHFSNAVLDTGSELYGDYHMPIGEPGFMNVETVGELLKKADTLGIRAEQGLRVAVEVRGKDREGCITNEKIVRIVLEGALTFIGK